MFWILIKDIRLPLTEKTSAVTDFAQKKLSLLIGRDNVGRAFVYKRSVDARHKDKITIVWSVGVEASFLPDDELLKNNNMQVISEPELAISYGNEELTARPLIVGFGPAGMFSALVLAENGYRPIVIERGADTEKRIKDVEEFYRTGKLNTESNIQFGAGGAGTFSDGKLVTRINDARCRYVLKRFVQFGAPENILVQAKPHVGTDLLVRAVSEIRDEIRKLGGEIRFGCSFKSVITDSFGNVIGVKTSDGDIPCGAVVLATGHSARDVYSYLMNSGFEISEKPMSVGLRIEHLREKVEEALYGQKLMKAAEKDPSLKEALGSAEYAYSYRENDRAVYTFCMCPGGEVVAGASEEGGTVVNGMSRHARDGRNSNCAVCVSVTPEDCKPFGGTMEFCRTIERKAYLLGGGDYFAPVQTVGDFLEGKGKTSELKQVIPTYMGDTGRVRPAMLEKLFPDFVGNMLKKGIRKFGTQMKGFDFAGAALTGAETRTSAPFRILRLEDGAVAKFPNLYPCGEGAGYAGGITSAAVDGISCAQKIMSRFKPF